MFWSEISKKNALQFISTVFKCLVFYDQQSKTQRSIHPYEAVHQLYCLSSEGCPETQKCSVYYKKMEKISKCCCNSFSWELASSLYNSCFFCLQPVKTIMMLLLSVPVIGHHDFSLPMYTLSKFCFLTGFYIMIFNSMC